MMYLDETGNAILLGEFDSDPFLSDDWPKIVKEAKETFPGIDIIAFQMRTYIGMASISEKLDPFKLAQEMIPKGIFITGSNKKVNIMSAGQMSEVLAQFNLG